MWPFGLHETKFLFVYLSFTTFFLGFLLLLKVLRRDLNLVKFSNSLPGPKGIPVIGNGLELLKFRGEDGIGSLVSKYTQIYGAVYKLWFGNILMVVLSDPQDLEIVLFSKKTIRRPPTLADYVDNSAITTNKKWKEQRKLQLPYYSNARIKSIIPRVNDHIQKFLPDFYALCGKGEFDIFEYLQYWSLNYHLKIHMNMNEEFSFRDVKKLLDDSPRPLDIYSSTFYEISSILRIVSNLVNKTNERDTEMQKIAEKLMENKLLHKPTETEFAGERVEKFDRPLLSAIRKFEMDEKIEKCVLHNLKEILMTFSTNMSQILAAFIFVVAAHPDIQDKLHKELNEVLEDKKPADVDIINRLTYMHRVFMETMRWQTISAITLRHLDEPLKIGSHIFPANTGLIIDFYNLHHNPKYYPNPEKIDPDRFLPENINSRPKCSFLPFSEGPRGCLGKNFALTSMKLMAVALLQNFSFNTNVKCEDIKFSGGFIRQSVAGYKVSLKLRQS